MWVSRGYVHFDVQSVGRVGSWAMANDIYKIQNAMAIAFPTAEIVLAWVRRRFFDGCPVPWLCLMVHTHSNTLAHIFTTHSLGTHLEFFAMTSSQCSVCDFLSELGWAGLIPGAKTGAGFELSQAAQLSSAQRSFYILHWVNWWGQTVGRTERLIGP